MSLQPISLDQYCPTISYSFKIAHLRDTHLIDILVISFNGNIVTALQAALTQG